MDNRPVMVLRARRETDLARIVGWVPDSGALFLFAGSRLRWPLTESQLAALDEIEGMTAWVLVDESLVDEPIGHFDLAFSGAEARLGRVIVDPVRRGERLGVALASLALDRAWALGATRVRLNVIEDNIPAIRIYERLGFSPVEPAERPGVVSMVIHRGAAARHS